MCDEVSSFDLEANVALGVDGAVFSLVFCGMASGSPFTAGSDAH